MQRARGVTRPYFKSIAPLSVQEESKMHDTPANITLNRDENGKKRVQEWNYCSAIGMIPYQVSTSRPDILFSVHQCARFSSCHKRSHEEAVKRICRYLKRKKEKGIVCAFDPTKGIEAYVDADFVGSWALADSLDIR